MFSSSKKGFTLIEILIVISLISILTSISFSAYKNYQPSLHLNGSVRTLVSNLHYVQQASVAEQIQYGITFSSEEKKYEIKKFDSETLIIRTVFMPSSIISMEISEEIINNDRTIKYNSYGSVDTPGEIVLENTNNRKINIDVKASGFVKIVN